MSDQIITRDIASWIPKTYNDSTRSVRVAAVTENPVTVHDIVRGLQYSQVTLVDGVNLPANHQVPLLDSHNWRSVSNVLGSARNFSINGNALECDVFFSGTQMGLEVAQKVKEGHLTDFSVGFMPVESVWIPEGESSVIRGRTFYGPIQIVTKWNLLELSVTAIGKDRNAKVRIWDGEIENTRTEQSQPDVKTDPIKTPGPQLETPGSQPLIKSPPDTVPPSPLHQESQPPQQPTSESPSQKTTQQRLTTDNLNHPSLQNNQDQPSVIRSEQPNEPSIKTKRDELISTLIYIVLFAALIACAFI